MKSLMGPIVLIVLLSISFAGQTGGTYDLSHNLIAGGGSRSVGAQFTVEGTAGQNLAGTLSGGGTYRLRGGFWAFEALVPTAASVSISGQIRTSQGNGIPGIRLTLADIATGEIHGAVSSSFGYYRFEDVIVGRTYILSLHTNRFTFEPNTRVVTLLDEISDEDFVALPGT